MNQDQKRLLFAFVAIIVILFLWTYLSKPSAQKTAQGKVPQESTKVVAVEKEPEITVKDSIVIDREAYRFVLVPAAGASVKSFYFKKYNIDIVPENKLLFISKYDGTDSLIVFGCRQLDDSVVFQSGKGQPVIRKVYHFDEAGGFKLTIGMPDTAARQLLSLKSGIRITEVKNRSEDLRHFGIFAKNNKVENISKKVKDEFEYPEKWEWLCLRNKYFLLVINDNGGTVDRTDLFKFAAPVVKKTMAGFGCAFGAGGSSCYGVELESRQGFNLTVRLLPIKYSELSRFKQAYEQVGQSGIWSPIARIILLVFNFFYRLFGNYGIAIVIFAVLLKAIFFPLSKQMIISQQKMQMLQPEIKKIQQKYKNDAQALNQEMMHIYKAYKVNPFSGCLPLLVQMPIFFALYQTLAASIEFRQAGFILWLTDLSLKDPYYILPIGMGIMMLVQSLMTTIDPRQRLMVLLMPIFMIFIFLNLPSGLQLYWFTYNILTLLENYLVKKGGIK